MNGILNIGNTCFINSSLQILFNIKSLRDYILSDSYNQSILEYYNKNKKNLDKNYELYKNLLINIKNIFISLNSGINITENIKSLCVNLKKLSEIDFIASNISNFSIHNDAEEFLSFILDKIEDYTIDNNFLKIETFKNQYKNNNFIISNFKIQQITQYKCLSCNNLTKLNFNNYLNKLQLSIKQKNIHSLEDALLNYTTTHLMDDYKCEKCNRKSKAKERTLIINLPNYIIIQLLRFDNNGMKIKKNIKIPFYINMNKYSHKIQNTQFELESVNCHIDFNMYAGHYISYVKRKNQWFITDDDNIKKISNEMIERNIENLGYFFVYKKI